jgi:NHLM bacteriocin system ABC transporter peptidase/ATP-binding protein
MILAYHGRWVALEELRHAAGVSRDGVKASNLLRAAAIYGLSGRGVTCQPADLAKLALPAVVFWHFNHFVVVEAYGGRHVSINDPASGPRRVTLQEFDDAFTGVVLSFAPGPDFVRGGRRPSVTAALRRRILPFVAGFAAILVLGLLLLAPGLALPGLQRAFTDFYLVAGLHDWLWWLVGGVAAVAALRMLLTYLQHHVIGRLQVRLGIASNARLLWHILHMPILFFAQRNGGEVANRAGIGDRLSGLLTGSLAVAAVNLLAIVALGAVMLTYDLALGGLALAFAAVELALLFVMVRTMDDQNRRFLQEEGRLNALTYQGFANLEDIKASGTEELYFRRWAGLQAMQIVAQQDMTTWQRLLSNLVTLLSSVAVVALVLVGGLRVMEGAITVGMLVAFQTLMSYFNSPVASFVGLSAQMQTTRGYLEKLDDVLEHELDPLLVEGRTTEPLPPLGGLIELDGATYGYAKVSAPFLRDISLSIAPGTRIAVIGPSGSGKSTLGRLIVGLAPAQSGSVRLNGVALERIDNAELRGTVAYVDQTVTLFPGTFRDNIAMWDAAIPEEQVVRAAKDAMMHEVIAARPAAYDSVLEEDGRNLSGGERQRIAIARALATNPSVLVLDEATSALDALLEKRILDNVRHRGCSAVIISHRLSAIRDCDEIVVLDRGRVAERGGHARLLAGAGLYARLVGA